MTARLPNRIYEMGEASHTVLYYANSIPTIHGYSECAVTHKEADNMTSSLHGIIYSLIIFALLCLNGCESNDTKQTRRHIEAAIALTPIVEAIEQYYADNNEYPKELVNLIPTYLNSLPPLPENTSWLTYDRNDENKTSNSAKLTAKEYYLYLDIDAPGALQRDEILCYYPKCWRSSPQLEDQPERGSAPFRRPVALDDNWVRYRD